MADYYVVISRKQKESDPFVADPHDYRFSADRWGSTARAKAAARSYAERLNLNPLVDAKLLTESAYNKRK